jgi:cytochrome c oxidase accessory protein FixG
MIQKYRSKVKIVYTLILIFLPFLKINGHSALRFDIPSLKLFFFGFVIDINNFFLVLILTFFIIFVFIFATQVFGRVWCGWLCPQTVIVDFTRFIDFMKKKPVLTKAINYLLVFIMSILIAANMIWYFVSPYDFFPDLINGKLSSTILGFWIVLTGITFLNFAFIRHTFCKTVCPYAKLQSVLYDDYTMIIAMDPERQHLCMGCAACVRACPVNIDIGKGVNSACIMCAECIDACEKMMRKNQNQPSLIRYSYGYNNEKKFFRLPVLISGILTLLFFILFLFLLFSMKPFEFEVFPNQKFSPRQTGENIINSYELVIENKSNEPLKINLTLENVKNYKIEPNNIFEIKSNQTLNQTIYLLLPVKLLEKRPILRMNLIASSQKGDKVKSELSFRRPFKRKKKKK